MDRPGPHLPVALKPLLRGGAGGEGQRRATQRRPAIRRVREKPFPVNQSHLVADILKTGLQLRQPGQKPGVRLRPAWPHPMINTTQEGAFARTTALASLRVEPGAAYVSRGARQTLP